MDSVAASREKIVLQWSWTVVGVHDVAWLAMNVANPLGELTSVWNCGGKENVVDVVRKQDQCLFLQ